MEIVDEDFKNGFVATFKYAVKVMPYYLHVIYLFTYYLSFLETCKSYGLCLAGLNIRKNPFIEFETDDLIVS